VTDQSDIAAEGTLPDTPPQRARRYELRRLSYATTYSNPLQSATIRTMEWMTAKYRLLRLVRSFEKSGSPIGVAFWSKAVRHMGIRIETPPEEIARIPKTGPVVVVANHPSGLVDGMIMAEMVSRLRPDFKILSRSLLSGIPEIEEFMIPVPFPHEEEVRELGLVMRERTMKQLKAGGVMILFPAGRIAMSETWWGPAVEGEWNVFTHKIARTSGATIVPIYFPGQNSRAFHIANKISDTLRQGLLLNEIKRTLNKPQRPVIGQPITPEDLRQWEGNPRGFLTWLRDYTLGLGQTGEGTGPRIGP
jgi:putative hemolysin